MPGDREMSAGLLGLDVVTRLEAGKGADAVRNVPNTLAIFETHFPRKPVLPGVLILGSLSELAERLLQEQTGRPWRLASAQQQRFRHFVQPGDSMQLSVELKRFSDDEAVLAGSVRVEGQLMVSIRELRLVPKSDRGTR
jgi:3-hydroxyacyl-[acyl-carrier-protein] dehydratase